MLADLTAVKSGRLTQKSLLGVQTISSVPDRGVPLTNFQRQWTIEGLDPKLVPEKRKPVDVFREACKSVATKKDKAPTGNLLTQVLSEAVVNDGGECVYQITRVVKDKANRVVDHPKAMRMVFNKTTEQIDCEPMDPDSYMALRDIEQRVLDYFNASKDAAPGSSVRTAVRETLLGLGATNIVRNSSVYFVPITGYSTVEALQRVLDNLYGGDAFIHVIPWLDTEATRDIVEKAHTSDIKTQCEDQVTELLQRLTPGTDGQVTKPRKDYVANQINDRIALSRKVKEYETLLGRELDEIKAAMELLDDQIDKLMGAAA